MDSGVLSVVVTLVLIGFGIYELYNGIKQLVLSLIHILSGLISVINSRLKTIYRLFPVMYLPVSYTHLLWVCA